MSADGEAWEWIVTALSREFERNPAVKQREIAEHLLSRCGYEIADPVYPYAPVRDARVALTLSILGMTGDRRGD